MKRLAYKNVLVIVKQTPYEQYLQVIFYYLQLYLASPLALPVNIA